MSHTPNWNCSYQIAEQSYLSGNTLIQINYNALEFIDFMCIDPAEIAFNPNIVAVWRIKKAAN